MLVTFRPSGMGGIHLTNEIYIEAGNRIKNLRKSKGYTREKLAEMADISPKFLYEIETGSKGFSAQTLCMLANVLNTSCDYILYGAEECLDATDIDNILNRMPYDKTQEIVKIFNAIYKIIT